MPTPYRSGMWKAYSQVKDVEIDIYYCTSKEKDRYWDVVSTTEITEKVLKGVSLFTQTHINFSIVRVFKKYDAWFIGGYSVPTCQLLIVLCKLYNIPYVLMIDGINPLRLNEENKIKKILKSFFIKGQFLSLANGISGKKLVMKYGLSEAKVINQYLTVDVNYFLEHRENKQYLRQEVRNELNICITDIVILYVGRIVKEKGIQDLISASKILKDRGFPIKILIVGEGEYRSYLEKENTNDDNIIFSGEVSYNNLYKYYYTSDIFILPTYDDAWGLTINEAMACGLPIITTVAAGANLDLIDNNGYTYTPGDINEMVSSLTKMFGEEIFSNTNESISNIINRLDTFGENSLEIIRNHKFANSKEGFEKVVEKLRTVL
jgi:glycosyltransferase involved in cell wall biosynthesis